MLEMKVIHKYMISSSFSHSVLKNHFHNHYGYNLARDYLTNNVYKYECAQPTHT